MSGDLDGARTVLEESFSLWQEWSGRTIQCYTLECLAMIANAQARYAYALHLAGAANAQRELTGFHLNGPQQTQLATGLQPAREALGEQVADEAWEAGQAMTLAETVAYVA